MRGPFVLLVLALFCLFAPTRSEAAKSGEDSIGFVYYSPGVLWGPIGTLRLGRNSWELGFNPGNYGGGALQAVHIDKMFHVGDSNVYVAFGPAVAVGKPFGVGFYAGTGFEWRLWGQWLRFRAELAAIGMSSNQSGGFAHLGLSLHI